MCNGIAFRRKCRCTSSERRSPQARQRSDFVKRRLCVEKVPLQQCATMVRPKRTSLPSWGTTIALQGCSFRLRTALILAFDVILRASCTRRYGSANGHSPAPKPLRRHSREGAGVPIIVARTAIPNSHEFIPFAWSLRRFVGIHAGSTRIRCRKRSLSLSKSCNITRT